MAVNSTTRTPKRMQERPTILDRIYTVAAASCLGVMAFATGASLLHVNQAAPDWLNATYIVAVVLSAAVYVTHFAKAVPAWLKAGRDRKRLRRGW
jgi:hypothetical protein